MVLPGLTSLPVIDRDEARFAQASVQMAETNDFLNIRFQDEALGRPTHGWTARVIHCRVLACDLNHICL